MKYEIIKPANYKKETFYLITAMIFIFLATSILMVNNRQEKNSFLILENEISSYEKFSGIEQSLYADLQNSLTEIEQLKNETGNFPTIQELEDEYISPFSKDFTWKERGIDWSEKFENKNIYIIGISKDTNKIGNFLIDIKINDISNSDIFYNNTLSKESFNENILKIRNEFKKIIPYTGKNERNKWKGGIKK